MIIIIMMLIIIHDILCVYMYVNRFGNVVNRLVPCFRGTDVNLTPAWFNKVVTNINSSPGSNMRSGRASALYTNLLKYKTLNPKP